MLSEKTIFFKCTIHGRPIVKKNTKRFFGPGRVVYSPQFKLWEQALILHMRQNHRGKSAVSEPIAARFKFYFKDQRAEADLSNLVEGPQDALKTAGVIEDDRWIHVLHATKHFGEEPRIEIELMKMEVA